MPQFERPLPPAPAEKPEKLKPSDRRVGLTVELSDEWIEAVRTAPAPPEYSLDDEPT